MQTSTLSNHPNRSRYRYLRHCPRGFSNEVTFYRVSPSEIEEAEAFAADVNSGTDGSALWSEDKRARAPGVAVDWADREWV